MADLFRLRPAQDDDLVYLQSYCYAEGMDNIPGCEGVQVAVNDDDIPVGFIRLVQGTNGFTHVNPVVVYGPWRGYGVGRALVEWARAERGPLRLVARGGSVAFYHALGFEPCAWEAIDTTVTENCDGCGLIEECQPLPMAWD